MMKLLNRVKFDLNLQPMQSIEAKVFQQFNRKMNQLFKMLLNSRKSFKESAFEIELRCNVM